LPIYALVMAPKANGWLTHLEDITSGKDSLRQLHPSPQPNRSDSRDPAAVISPNIINELCEQGSPKAYEGLEFSGRSFSLSTIRQSSATDPALSLCIMLLRWTFTVVSVTPISPAICLFSRPSTT